MSIDTTIERNGKITPYGLACGYVEQYEGATYGVRLWQEGCYHVRVHHTSGYVGYIQDSWESFGTLTEARRAYVKRISAIKRVDAGAAAERELREAEGS